jgi:hypothetical protein
MSRRILNGWKQISDHIERGVRTAQRWEAQLGMPVHRPALKDRSAVVAFSDELDRWLSRSAEKRDADGEESEELLALVDQNVTNLTAHTAELAARTRRLREQLRRSLVVQHERIASRMCATAAPSSSPSGIVPFRPKHSARLLQLP